MAQQVSTVLLRGGLDLVTPAIAVPSGSCIAALNYEPDVTGYRRIGGYERYDGRPSPHKGADAGAIAARRALIEAVPGSGPVRGVWVYDGHLYAFRDTVSGEGAMYRDTASGWEQMTFGQVVPFTGGSVAFTEGQTLSGATSFASAQIERVVTRSGNYAADPGNTATGYLVVSNMVGTFEATEVLNGGLGGAAVCSGVQDVSLVAGGDYTFENHNFYGPAFGVRMYFANGVGTAFEWDGSTLSPILTGTADGPLSLADFILTRGGDNVLVRGGGRVMLRGAFDKPTHVAQFSEHLFLAFPGGSVLFSGIGEPLDYRTISGAGEIGVSDEITGMISGATLTLMLFCRGRVEYVTGRDSTTFVKTTFSDSSGAYAKTMQMMDQPLFLDDAGVRRMSTTDAFGNWRMGTITQPIEPMFRARREADIRASASLRVKGRDQYRLFYEDGVGVTIYLGRKHPESMPFKLPIVVTCSCSGEIDPDQGGERLFVGSDNGFVYELDVGTSFDGAAISSFIRLPWNGIGAPLHQKRFHKATLELDAPSAGQIGIGFDVDYNRPGNISLVPIDQTLDAGSRMDRAIDTYANLDWSGADQGVVETYLNGLGRNLAMMIVTESATEDPHTLSAFTLNFTPRKLTR